MRGPSDLVLASSSRLPSMMRLMVSSDPSISAKHLPYSPESGSYSVSRGQAGSNGATSPALPVPPQELWEGYATRPSEYLEGGQRDVKTMMEILGSSGLVLEKGARLIEIGCAGGRMLRWFADFATEGEVWGTDIDAQSIKWCQLHLSPPFFFTTVTTSPHLPFEDRYFDLIYCGSVFTHISELADAWILELRRILRPGGYLYITVHDKNTIRILSSREYADFFLSKILFSPEHKQIVESDFLEFAISRTPKGAQVFYDIDHLRHQWGRFLTVQSVTPSAYGYQTAVVLKK
ncbi:MAG: class I SAM-dependent methyltransferase [Isosphaeraceae bacterium]|nr:class I SAM-dependent methyltransferase [Isosphaeraceae bacterium]